MILTEAAAKQKRALITSHKNAIRGILMYHVKGKCIRLLEDDLEEEEGSSSFKKISTRDVGPAAKYYLFRACELDDASFEAME
jgi:hypothetical protein